MVNGAVSRIVYIGAFVCILACIAGIIILAVTDHETPNELMLALTACLGIVGGSHILPPISDAATKVAQMKLKEGNERNA
jgi:hypothetical protein